MKKLAEMSSCLVKTKTNNNDLAPGITSSVTLDSAVGGLLANIRIPALIGTADEIKLASGYELSRGSSPTQDNLISGEDLSSQADGTNRIFHVDNYPIVKGNGLGQITTNTNDVEVDVDGVKVIVAKVDGLNGLITVAIAPPSGSTVTVIYYFKKTDTKVIDENLSDQLDGATVTFYTHHKPIVDGSNGGVTTTNVANIVVKINRAIVLVSNLDGVDGNFTLATPPLSTDTLTVTYYFNMYANTADDLPFPNPTEIVRVGYSPETTDFIENVDYAIIGNQIQWGSGYVLTQVVHSTGSEFFDSDQISAQLVDDKIYNEDVSSYFVVIGAKSFTVKHIPIVDGTGKDIVTDDPTTVVVTVDGVVVDVNRVDGDQGVVYLENAPGIGHVVLATYWRSRLEEDTYAITVVNPGVVGVGTYTVSSAIDGFLSSATLDPLTHIQNSNFLGVDFITGPTTDKGYSINETVTLTFTSNTQFTVTSSVVVGGSSGVGVTGSTYVDNTTGLMFTIGPDPLYATADYIVIDVVYNDPTALPTPIVFTTSFSPNTSIPGVQLIVLNTTNIAVGDTTDVFVFDKSGKQPAVGTEYYITYYYEKTDFSCAVYTRFRDITDNFGDLDVNNSLVLASYLMFLNGANALILCQVKKAVGSDLAPDQYYFDTLTRLQQDVNGINPDVIFPVTSSQSVINAVSQHCATMSSKRNKRERISFFGFAVGTEPLDAAEFTQSLSFNRMTGVYPDGAVIELVEPDGTVSDSVIDGTYLAAAYCGLNVNPIYDVATPMTRKTLQGFKQLVRSLDENTMDLVAARGMTIIVNIQSSFIVRHALTTDMTNTLSREQMVITTTDFIQQETRRVLDPYIGQKMNPGLPSQCATTLGSMLSSAKDSQVITDYKGVTAQIDPNQPDYITVTGFFVPMFGLNYIDVEYVVRVSF